MINVIPFLNSQNDMQMATELHPDSNIVRIVLANSHILRFKPRQMGAWIDTGVDSLHKGTIYDAKLRDFFENRDGGEVISEFAPDSTPAEASISRFTKSLLDLTLSHRPKWISVPQLPIELNRHRNKANRLFAKATGKWRSATGFSGSLIMPIVLSRPDQSHYKPMRDKIIEQARKNVGFSGANALWVVDASLKDLTGSKTLGTKRLPDMIKLHERISDAIPAIKTVVGGPYWALNLILWARGLVTEIAVGLGGGYQYFLSGGRYRPGKIRMAIPPLRRLAETNDDLKKWLREVSRVQSLDGIVRDEFDSMAKNMQPFQTDRGAAKRQIAEFYRDWLGQFEHGEPKGRSLALFQDLSNAFVIGKQIKKVLPPSEKPATAPGQVAEQLMLNCL